MRASLLLRPEPRGEEEDEEDEDDEEDSLCVPTSTARDCNVSLSIPHNGRRSITAAIRLFPAAATAVPSGNSRRNSEIADALLRPVAVSTGGTEGSECSACRPLSVMTDSKPFRIKSRSAELSELSELSALPSPTAPTAAAPASAPASPAFPASGHVYLSSSHAVHVSGLPSPATPATNESPCAAPPLPPLGEVATDPPPVAKVPHHTSDGFSASTAVVN